MPKETGRQPQQLTPPGGYINSGMGGPRGSWVGSFLQSRNPADTRSTMQGGFLHHRRPLGLGPSTPRLLALPAHNSIGKDTMDDTHDLDNTRSTQYISLTLLQADDVVAAGCRLVVSQLLHGVGRRCPEDGFKVGCSAPNCTGTYTEADQSAKFNHVVWEGQRG